ncbi:tetratricopeptide repeat protein [Longimicrobium terrae]|uniref:Tetratricopeptide (TPR) repeat protein n=1 Tax=Longimicrobium terrae TaxID=1639882 RepID=A0A841GTS8_9BACT|nr:tetratricopeptide repeat protein [Longimicrobium terrae]MBB4635645.1 tetratricopeptide (TPR) repeat protein [Longimicrobium terrae]MBB6070039.1 tetratricopeptide (TPR) repeat protein [Longimicrobium terrae]NNC32945.1 tetratricopeptide repeat protein [Longimicrobium terrae]
MAVQKARRNKRPHCMPLAPLRRMGDGSKPVGWEIIQVIDGELGVVLWNALRSIYEWVKPTPGESERLHLFGGPSAASRQRVLAAVGEAPHLAQALQTVSLLREDPGAAGPESIGEACAQISAWAEERSLLEVAGHFAEAGAYADPENPARANAAGRLCRRLGLPERSGAWFRRGRYASHRTKNRAERIRALLGYGALMRSLGRYEEAEAHYLLAAKLAERTRRRKQAAEAHHDLLSIAILLDDLETAEAHVWEALRLYPSRHPYLPVLGHDWAFALILRRFYSHAIPLVELALSRVRVPEFRTLMFSTLARAAAGARQAELHGSAEAQVLQHVSRFPEYAPAALVNLAQAAWLFNAWDRAEEFARRGLEAAQAHSDERYQKDALDLLKNLKVRKAPPSELAPALPDVIDSVRARFQARLREARPPRPPQE